MIIKLKPLPILGITTVFVNCDETDYAEHASCFYFESVNNHNSQDPAYATLRTQEQLGYTVFTGTLEMLSVDYFYLLLQGT